MPRAWSWVILALIVIVTAAVYAPLGSAEFINLDDPEYVAENHFVNEGFTAESLQWAFSVDRVPSGYHPLTQLSYMLDVAMFGPNKPGVHHLVNVAFHLGSVVMMYLFMLSLTAMPGRSLFITAIFALHPAHVESVAWIAERKDVVGVFFGLMTLWVYVEYRHKPNLWRYVTVLICFTLALLGKPMMVTLPVVMLLLDFWAKAQGLLSLGMSRLFLEKLPLFALAIASSVLTVITQRYMGAVPNAEEFPRKLREALAVVATGYEYLLMTFAPHDLAAYYPPLPPPAWKLTLAGVTLAAITTICVMQYRRRPYLIVGWLWYLVVLVPVLGILRAGGQAMADRYTYLSMTGLVIAVTWLVCEMRLPRRLLGAAAMMIVLWLTTLTVGQVQYWDNSVDLFKHTVAVTDRNAMAMLKLAEAYEQREDWPQSRETYTQLLKLKPGSARALMGLAFAAEKMGHDAEAAQAYQTLLAASPEHPNANYALGILLARRGEFDEAVKHLRVVARLYPESAEVHNILGACLGTAGRRDEAIAEFEAAVKADPGNPQFRANLERARKGQ